MFTTAAMISVMLVIFSLNGMSLSATAINVDIPSKASNIMVRVYGAFMDMLYGVFTMWRNDIPPLNVFMQPHGNSSILSPFPVFEMCHGNIIVSIVSVKARTMSILHFSFSVTETFSTTSMFSLICSCSNTSSGI